ncbi:hypothetical protein ATANTOWER_009559 [Ataeniobius toweri]|uniref:Uncharacterized protein n=1 Tax=Ataeniobius toweri TaxID=208326 RepID=A0ABU7BBE5_9TELE|nr:hypothetical protein [Ataeniobius toweri]
MCSVVTCDSWRRRAQRFILPEDPEKRLEWVQFLFEVNGQRLKESSWTDITVCSEHFTRNSFLTAAGTALLKCDAVPSVYQPDEPKQDTILPKDTACKHDQLKTCHSPTPGSSELNKEEYSTLISVPASPASSEVSESSVSDYCKMLHKIENLDIIKEKVNLLQMNKRYAVSERQLLQLFSAKCPLCQSKVKTEKVVRGVLLVLNQQCLQCDYSKQWKNLNNKSITEASDDHQTECMEISLETVSTDGKTVGITDIVQSVDEESDRTEETDESSDLGEVGDSDDNWEPEDEPFSLKSEEESSCEEASEVALLKHRELCTDCGMFFEIQKPHTCEYKIKPFPCNICGKRCVSEHALTVHSRVHNINYQHPCKYCHVGFKTKMDKITHEQTHLTQKSPYKCSDCSETFATHKERKDHLESHTEQRQLKCPICGIKFFSSLALQRHSMVHTGEKPFKCSVCQRGFNQSGHLKSHMRLHTGERPYKCQHCNKCFNHNVSLKSHVQRCHTASGHQQKSARPRGCVDGDPLDDGGTDSRIGNVDEDQAAVKEVSIKRSKFKKKTTGRPIGRPKKNLTGTVIKDEKGPGQGINTKTAKVRKRKPRRRKFSSEESEEEMSKSEESFDFKEEDQQQQNEKEKSRQKAKDSEFEPTEIKKRRVSNNVCKNSRSPRGKQRKKSVEEI